MATRSTPKIPEIERINKTAGQVVRPNKTSKDLDGKTSRSITAPGNKGESYKAAEANAMSAIRELYRKLRNRWNNVTSQVEKDSTYKPMQLVGSLMTNLSSYVKSNRVKQITTSVSQIKSALFNSMRGGNAAVYYSSDFNKLESACQALVDAIGRNKTYAPIRHSESGTYLEHASDVVRDFAFIYGDIPIDDIADIM